MQVFVYTCAPLLDEFETTDSKPGFGQQNQFCVALRLVLFLQKTLSNGDDDRIGFFDFFYDRKTRVFATRIFVCRAASHYQSDFNFDTALNTVLPFYTNTAFMPTLHINAARISLYCDLLSIRSLDTVLIQNLILRNIIFPRRFHGTPTTLERCIPCHNTSCFFVTARLAVQLNRIIQNHSTCHYVATTHCIFPKSSSITLVVATVFSKTVAHNSYRLIFIIFIHRYSQSNGYTPKLRLTTRLFPVLSTSLVVATVFCKSSSVVCFLYGAFSKGIVLRLLRLILWVLHKSIMSATPLG